MITQTTQASASQKPTHTHGKCDAVAFANAFERLRQAKGVSGPLICEAKQIHVVGKVTSLCGYLLVSCYIMRPKQTILFLLLSVLTACSNTGQNEELSSTDSVQEFPTDFIKKVCSERKDAFRLVDVNFKKLNPIDSSFYKKWFDKKKVSNDKDFILEFDKYTSYYFYDFKDLDKKFLFSIINDDEIGYYHLFHFTFDKEKKQFTQIDYIGQTGGDGGDYNEDNFKFNSNGDILILTSISTYDEDFDGGYTQQYDSTVTQIEFDLLKTKYSKLDNLNRTDTIWDKK